MHSSIAISTDPENWCETSWAYDRACKKRRAARSSAVVIAAQKPAEATRAFYSDLLWRRMNFNWHSTMLEPDNPANFSRLSMCLLGAVSKRC
jgi:hypothetical protein